MTIPLNDMYHIESMSNRYADEISLWVYPAECAIYSFQKDEETIRELMNGEHYACTDSQKHLVGYFCFGKSAQIPAVQENAYRADMLDIGLGLKPELCGKGLGADFMKSGMEYARSNLGAANLRLSVACFNKRAINLYGKLGFEVTNEVTHRVSGNKFYVMQSK